MLLERKIKILFLHTYYKQRGGEDHAFESEVALFRERGYDVEVLTFTNRHGSFIKFVLFPFNVFSYFKTKAAIKKHRPSIVHIHNLFFAASPSILYAIKERGLPCVLTVHNFRFFCPSGTLFNKNQLYTKSIGKVFPWRAIKDKVYNGFAASTFYVAFTFWLHKQLKSWNKIDTLIFLNKYAKNMFEEVNPISYTNQIVLKGNSVQDPEARELQRSKTFIFVGRLSKEKGIQFLLEAFSTSSADLLLIGDGLLRKQVVSFSQKYKNIKYLGYQSKDVIVQQLCSCGALVLGSACMEMAPLTVIEALACGTPVIAPSIATMESFVLDGETGFLYEINNANSFRRAIDKYTGLSEERKRQMGLSARRHFEQHFTQDNSYQLLAAIYESLLYRN